MKLRTLVWQRFRTNLPALCGAVLITLLMVVSLLTPLIAPYSPTDIDVDNVLSPPTAAHWCGTDDLGRDVLTRMLYGSRISLSVGFVAMGIALMIGIVVGAVAGYFGGFVDSLLMRFVDIMMTFPTFFLILAVVAIVERPSILIIMVIIGATGWMGIARLVRAEFLTMKERDFVHAALAMGAGHGRIIFRHILPNAISPVFVAVTLGIAGAILTESALSFLGLGVQPPDASWGNILTLGKNHIEMAWWLSVFPGLAILVTVLSYNLVGEGLRDSIDPRLWSSSS